MNKVAINLVKLDKWKHNKMPKPRKRLDKKVMSSGQWLPTWSVGQIWQVRHPFNGMQFIVGIGEKLFMRLLGVGWHILQT